MKVFLSYTRSDRAVASEIAAYLQEAGHEVWYDAALSAGRSYNEEIRESMAAADRVVVIWSPKSVTSRYVDAEATEAYNTHKILPIATADLSLESIPIPFNAIHTISADDFPALLKELERESDEPGFGTAKPKGSFFLLTLAAAIAVLVCALIVYQFVGGFTRF